MLSPDLPIRPQKKASPTLCGRLIADSMPSTAKIAESFPKGNGHAAEPAQPDFQFQGF